jgi:hypothetical protein
MSESTFVHVDGGPSGVRDHDDAEMFAKRDRRIITRDPATGAYAFGDLGSADRLLAAHEAQRGLA